ncbi:hypothetical protein BpHYR1_041567 [Brachionus plicatilis]|uniref:Uncharacterized protein n=1 Tax=Brachionus plicatilis TaxID=10195 RepID=A0A3M7SRK0_BRAPC|nr:hypothetical protein BpHYR1_041567 [Brachionus plicatilis]
MMTEIQLTLFRVFVTGLKIGLLKHMIPRQTFDGISPVVERSLKVGLSGKLLIFDQLFIDTIFNILFGQMLLLQVLSHQFNLVLLKRLQLLPVNHLTNPLIELSQQIDGQLAAFSANHAILGQLLKIKTLELKMSKVLLFQSDRLLQTDDRTSGQTGRRVHRTGGRVVLVVNDQSAQRCGHLALDHLALADHVADFDGRLSGARLLLLVDQRLQLGLFFDQQNVLLLELRQHVLVGLRGHVLFDLFDLIFDQLLLAGASVHCDSLAGAQSAQFLGHLLQELELGLGLCLSARVLTHQFLLQLLNFTLYALFGGDQFLQLQLLVVAQHRLDLRLSHHCRLLLLLLTLAGLFHFFGDVAGQTGTLTAVCARIRQDDKLWTRLVVAGSRRVLFDVHGLHRHDPVVYVEEYGAALAVLLR